MFKFFTPKETKKRSEDPEKLKAFYPGTTITWEEIFSTERKYCEKIKEKLIALSYPSGYFSIEKRSEEYTTLLYKNIWIARIKATPVVQYIIIPAIDGNNKEYLPTNIEATISEIKKFIDYMDAIGKKKKNIPEKDLAIANKIKSFLIESGAEPDLIEIEKLSDRCRVLFLSGLVLIDFRTYKTKKSVLLLPNKTIEFDNIEEKEDLLKKIILTRLNDAEARALYEPIYNREHLNEKNQ